MFARVSRWSKQAAICTLSVMRLGYFGNKVANAVFVMRVAIDLCILCPVDCLCRADVNFMITKYIHPINIRIPFCHNPLIEHLLLLLYRQTDSAKMLPNSDTLARSSSSKYAEAWISWFCVVKLSASRISGDFFWI